MHHIHSIDCKVCGTIVSVTDTRILNKGKTSEYCSREMLIDTTLTLGGGKCYPTLSKFTFIGEKICGVLDRYHEGDNVEVHFTPKTTKRINKRGEVFFSCMNQAFSVKYAKADIENETYQ